MSSISTIPPFHVPCAKEWPALSPSKISSHDHNGTDNDWELLPEPIDGSAETSFERDAIRVVDTLGNEMRGMENRNEQSKQTTDPAQDKQHCLVHAASTPDFHYYSNILEEEEAEDSLASSSIVMVSGPSSVISSQSCWSSSSKISFRDAIMKEQVQEEQDESATERVPQSKEPKAVKKKPKFVVKSIRRCSSMGDVQSLARIVENEDHHHDGDHYSNDLIMGDTDAALYYNQKAQGKIGRKNGRKIRPDEAKRLQITMAKKDAQRQQQQAAASKKR